jgi:hypothetical protein
MTRALCAGILILFLAASAVNAQAIKRVAKKDKNDSSKTESVVRKQKDNQDSKSDQAKSDANQPKDEFIDKNGDGINDQVAHRKPTVIKRQEPQQRENQPQKPKVSEPQQPKVKAPEHQQPPARPKAIEPQKQKPKEPEKKENNSSRKSKH